MEVSHFAMLSKLKIVSGGDSMWLLTFVGWILIELCLADSSLPQLSSSMVETGLYDPTVMLPHHGRCEPIKITMCDGLRYNQTIMPNMLGHTKQEYAGIDVHQFYPLVKINCSPVLQLFLCTVYVPICTVLETPIPPCRSLCLSSRNGCEALMNKFGFRWPDSLDCNKFPIFGKDQLCVSNMEEGEGSPNGGGPPGSPGVGDYNPSVLYPQDPHQMLVPGVNYPNGYNSGPPAKSPMNISHHDLSFTCPLNFVTPAGMDYVFRIQGKEHKDCGMPCDGLLFESKERHLIRIWTGMWATFCLISTAFTVLTFCLEPERFEYPVRPIIFISLCYCFIGAVYVGGFFLGDKVACNEPFQAPVPVAYSSSTYSGLGSTAAGNIQMIRTITQGNKREECTLLFMALYFFTISNAIWWFVLTLSWFLNAGLKWSQEAIESNAHYFHLGAWALPAIMTITVLAMNRVEGDGLTGVCFVGMWNPLYLTSFVIIPLAVLLTLGTFFLVSGFVSVWRIRTIFKEKGCEIRKFDNLSFKIGLFSLLYLGPSVVLLVCYLYEQQHIDSYLMSWMTDICQRPEFGIPCPPVHQSAAVVPVRPNLTAFLIKYLAILLPGIMSGFWIWSEKTVSSWTRIMKHLFCCCRRSNESRRRDFL